MTAADVAIGLLEDIRLHCDITWIDADTDKKLLGYAQRGMAYIQSFSQEPADVFVEEGDHKALLLDYCRYGWNGVLVAFPVYYRSELVGLRCQMHAATAVMEGESDV